MSYLDILDQYAGYLIVQYHNKTKAIKTVKLFVNSSVCDGLPLELQNCFDLSTAVGAQLTLIGKIVGVPRNVIGLNLGYNFFNFTDYNGTPASNGFTDYASQPDLSGINLLDYNDNFVYVMNDSDMRTVIKLAILQNSKALTFKNIKEGLWEYFHGDIDVTSNVNTNDLLSNGDFENWSAGASAAPDGWLSPQISTETSAREASIIRLGTYSYKLTNTASSAGGAYQNFGTKKGTDYWKGKKVTIGCWVYSATASRVRIGINDTATESLSSPHSGNSTWEWLSVTYTISSSATDILAEIRIDTGSAISAYFDGAMCVEGNYTLIPSYDSMKLNYTAKTKYTIAMTVAQFLNLLPHPMCIGVSVSYV